MSVYTCICGEYKFYVTEGTVETEVFPINFLETSLLDEQESGYIFYRRKFQGELIFGGLGRIDDFNYFLAINAATPCEKLIFEIEKDGINYWTGYFSTSTGSWDMDECTFKVTPIVQDGYTDILERADNQFNVLDAAVCVDVTTVAYISGIYDIDFTHTKWLNTIIDWLAAQLVTVAPTVTKTFFTAATNPSTQDENKLRYLTIAQKANIIRPADTNPAVFALMSWNDLMEILWGMFQVAWDYDLATNTFRVEHISTFAHGTGLDLRTQKISKGSNKYNFVPDKMPKYEKFSFMEASDGNFVGVDIWYDDTCVNQNLKQNKRETAIDVTTDIEYIINVPDAISDSGWVIMCTFEWGGENFIPVDYGYLYPTAKLNMSLSWANLHHCYFMDNRVLLEGYMNNVLTTFFSAEKTKAQRINAMICDMSAYDPWDTIITELGETYLGGVEGYVGSANIKPTGETNFVLLYAPEENARTPIINRFGINVYLSMEDNDGFDDVIHLLFVFNQPIDAGVDIRIRERVYNGGILTYEGAWNNLTFTTGNLSEDWTHHITEIAGLVPGDCILIEIEYTAIEVYSFTGTPDATWSCGNPYSFLAI